MDNKIIEEKVNPAYQVYANFVNCGTPESPVWEPVYHTDREAAENMLATTQCKLAEPLMRPAYIDSDGNYRLVRTDEKIVVH